jgi:branched-chain amino acid transport system ATP-binding protein
MLRFERVSKHFGSLRAVKDVSLAFEKGLITSVIGPNGAGKSTLVNLAAGSYRVTSGQIRIDDVELTALKKHQIFKAGLARTYQNIRLFDNMTVQENLEVVMYQRQIGSLLAELALPRRRRALKEERVERARAVLDQLHMRGFADELAGHLAYGLQKKLEIGRVLMGEPSVILLDEPAAGLNPTESAEMRDLIGELRTRERVLLVIEHDMELVMSISDRIYVLFHGELLFSGTPSEVAGSESVQEAYLGRSEDLIELHGAFEARRRERRIWRRPGAERRLA